MIYLLGIIPFAILTGIILSRWRWGVILIFVWLLLEDLIRRLLPGQPSQITLVKDVLVFLTYCSFLAVFMIKNKKIWKPVFWGLLLFFAAVSIINVFNPNSPGLLFGLIGLRSYLWYLPLIFLGYHMFEKEERLLKFCRWLVYLSIPLFLFAVFQYLFYDTGAAIIRPFATAYPFHYFESREIPLLSSVFGMGHRYSRFSMLLFFLGLGLLASKFPSSLKKNKILLLMSIFSAFLGIVLSGARTAFVLTVIGGVLFFVFATYIKNSKIYYLWKNNRIWFFSLIAIILISLPIIFLLGNLVFFQASAFYFAFQGRIPWILEGLRSALANAKFFGMGTGTFSQGLWNISGGVEWLGENVDLITTGFRFETGFGKVILELGIFGMIIFYLFWGYLLYQMKREIKLLKHSNLRNLGLGIFIFSFLMLFWFTFVHHQIFGDATTLVVLWFFIGVFFGLRRSNREYTN